MSTSCFILFLSLRKSAVTTWAWKPESLWEIISWQGLQSRAELEILGQLREFSQEKVSERIRQGRKSAKVRSQVETSYALELQGHHKSVPSWRQVPISLASHWLEAVGTWQLGATTS